MELGIVSSRVALLLRSAEIKPLFRRFVRMNISSPSSLLSLHNFPFSSSLFTLFHAAFPCFLACVNLRQRVSNITILLFSFPLSFPSDAFNVFALVSLCANCLRLRLTLPCVSCLALAACVRLIAFNVVFNVALR